MLKLIVSVRRNGETVVTLMDDERPDDRIYTSFDNWEKFINEVKAGDYDLDKLNR